MRQAAPALLLVALSSVPALARDDEPEPATIDIAAPGGWVLKPDGETLIVSSPSPAELVYINTSKDEEIKRVKVEFQPTALALRGSTIFAAARGSSLLFALDAEDGKVKKQLKIPGSKLMKLATHPSSGPLFATNDSYDVLQINPETGKVIETIAEGTFLAVDPIKGDVLYTGTQKPIRDNLVLSRGPGNSVRVGVARSNRNSAIVKYSLKKEMKAVALNGNAAINGRALAVSPDGKKIAMVGGGGMQGEDGRRNYAIAVFDTKDLETQLGQVETGAYPSNIAFHPVLDIGVAEKSGGELIVFNARSYAPTKTITLPSGNRAPSTEAGLLTFGGRGAKLVAYQPGLNLRTRAPRTRARTTTAGQDHQGLRHLIPLELTDEQKVELAKAFPAERD